MVSIYVPKDMEKNNTAVLIDFERTLTKHNLLMDLFRITPLKAAKSFIRGAAYAFTELLGKKSFRGFKFNWTFGIKKSYCDGLTEKQRKMVGRRVYQIDKREGIEDLLDILNYYGWRYDIITSSDKSIAEGFFDDFVQPENIIGTSSDYFVWEHQKEDLARQKKRENEYLVCIGDSEIDAGMCRHADISFKITSPLSILFGSYKVRGYSVKSLHYINLFFDFIHDKDKIPLIP